MRCGRIPQELLARGSVITDQRIDFTQSASVRSAELILWAPLVWADLQANGIAKTAQFEKYWSRLNDEEKDLPRCKRPCCAPYNGTRVDR